MKFMNKQKIVIPSGIGTAAVLRFGRLSWGEFKAPHS